MTKKNMKKPKINYNDYDDHDDYNDYDDDDNDNFLYSTFTQPDSPTMNETETDFYSDRHHVSETRENEKNTGEEVKHTIGLATTITGDDDGDAVLEMTTTPAIITSKLDEQEEADDLGSLFTDIDNITINNNDTTTTNNLELDFSGMLIIENSSSNQSNVVDDADDTSAILIDDAGEMKEEFETPDHDSSSYVDDWDVVSVMQYLKNQDSSCDWEVMSSVQSVMSMETFNTQVTTKKLTFKDILAKRTSASGTGTSSNNKGLPNFQDIIMLPSLSSDEETQEECNKCSSLMLPIFEKIDSSFDEYHEREGYKYGRGGKKPYQFRGKRNQKAGR